jgi:hypothetical protein
MATEGFAKPWVEVRECGNMRVTVLMYCAVRRGTRRAHALEAARLPDVRAIHAIRWPHGLEIYVSRTRPFREDQRLKTQQPMT